MLQEAVGQVKISNLQIMAENRYTVARPYADRSRGDHFYQNFSLQWYYNTGFAIGK
jgi:hypothetical protein